MNCNFATHVTCPLALMTYKYNELQVSFTTKKLSYKVSCQTPFFLIVQINNPIRNGVTLSKKI